MLARPLKHLLQHFLLGSAAAVVFGAGILWFDIAEIGSLVDRSSEPGLWIFLLFVGLVSTFGPIALVMALMMSNEETNADR